jgi:hypothetical protein
MVRIAIALAAISLVLLAACGGGESSAAPKDWKPMPGASDAWSNGNGSSAQEYRYTRKAFAGTLADLASVVTIDALLRHRGAKSSGSLPFAACPVLAGVATFALSDGGTLQEGFTVRNGVSLRISYSRPSGSPVDSNAAAAMQRALCSRP